MQLSLPANIMANWVLHFYFDFVFISKFSVCPISLNNLFCLIYNYMIYDKMMLHFLLIFVILL